MIIFRHESPDMVNKRCVSGLDFAVHKAVYSFHLKKGRNLSDENERLTAAPVFCPR